MNEMIKNSKIVDISNTTGEIHAATTDSAISLTKIMKYNKELVKTNPYFKTDKLNEY